MSVGIQVTKSELDNVAGSVARSLFDVFDNVKQIKSWLDGVPGSVLEAPPFSYSEDEVAVLKSAYADLAQLVGIFEGAESLAQAKDFTAFVKRLTGILH